MAQSAISGVQLFSASCSETMHGWIQGRGQTGPDPPVFDIIFQIKSKLEMNRWIAPLKYEDNEDVVLHMKWTLLF